MPIERSVRRTRRLLILTTTLAILALIIGCIGLVRQSKSDSIRAADRKAQEVSQVSQCFQSVKTAPTILKTLGLIDDLATNSIKGNREALKSAKPGDPLIAVRKASLRRLIPKRASLRRLIKKTQTSVPTKKSCNKLAADLGVDPSKLNR